MLRIVTESDPEFRELEEVIQKNEKGYDYDRLAKEIKRLNKTASAGFPGEKIVITFTHSAMSNLVYALKRRELTKDIDYKIFKLDKKSKRNKPQILVQPLGATRAGTSPKNP